MADLQSRERAEGYLRGMLSALRKLQAGISVRWRVDRAQEPDDLWAAASEPRFGYDLGAARRIISDVASASERSRLNPYSASRQSCYYLPPALPCDFRSLHISKAQSMAFHLSGWARIPATAPTE